MIMNDGKEHGYIELWITDDHAEYPLPSKPTNACQIIWDRMNMEDLFGEKEAERLNALLPKDLIADNPEYTQYVWRVSGKLPELLKIFTEYVNDVMEGPVGGDDDVYDYWPGAFSVCQQIATDLDKLTGNNSSIELMKTLYNKMVETRGEVSEFEPTW